MRNLEDAVDQYIVTVVDKHLRGKLDGLDKDDVETIIVNYLDNHLEEMVHNFTTNFLSDELANILEDRLTVSVEID